MTTADAAVAAAPPKDTAPGQERAAEELTKQVRALWAVCGSAPPTRLLPDSDASAPDSARRPGDHLPARRAAGGQGAQGARAGRRHVSRHSAHRRLLVAHAAPETAFQPHTGGIYTHPAEVEEEDEVVVKELSPAEAAAAKKAAEGTSFNDPESIALIDWVVSTGGKGWWEGQVNSGAKKLAKEQAAAAVMAVRDVKRTVKQVNARWNNMKDVYKRIKAALGKSGAAAYDGKCAWFLRMDQLMTEREAKVPQMVLEAGEGKIKMAMAGADVQEEDGKVKAEPTAAAKAAAEQAKMRLSGDGAGAGGKKMKQLMKAQSAIIAPLQAALEKQTEMMGVMTTNLANLVTAIGGKGVAPAVKRRRGASGGALAAAREHSSDVESAEESAESSGLSGLSADALKRKLRQMTGKSKQ